MEQICQHASLEDPGILPFGDARNTSSCQLQCFKAGEEGGSISKGWNFPDGTLCGAGNDDRFCVDGLCQVILHFHQIEIDSDSFVDA